MLKHVFLATILLLGFVAVTPTAAAVEGPEVCVPINGQPTCVDAYDAACELAYKAFGWHCID